MIYGTDSKMFTALEFVKNSNVLFYLTGSRFFGTSTPDSDWDFFTQWTETIETILSDASFLLETESYKEDPIMCSVWKRDNVHIQVVNNVRMKHWVQYKLYPVFQTFKPNKEQARLLWTVGTQLYRDGQEELLQYGTTHINKYPNCTSFDLLSVLNQHKV